MENINNNFENTNLYQNNLIIKTKDSSREEFKKINEEHYLSLRKKRNNKHINHIKNLNLAQNHFSYNIDINFIINNIRNEEIYMKYKNSESEIEKLNYLMQMIISKNNNMLKYGLFELKKYLSNIKDKKVFESKNLLNYFNEKMLRFLFELLFKKNDAYLNLEEYYQIMILLCNIISNLCELNDFYSKILLEYFPDLLLIIKNERDIQIQNAIYIVNSKILLIKNIDENDLIKLSQIYQNFFENVYNELIYLNNESNNNQNIFNLKELFPTLLNIISTIIYNNNQIIINIINNSNINIPKLLHISSFINKYITSSFMETDILKSSLNFLSAFLNFYKLNKNLFNKENDDKFREIMKNIELGKHVILYVYDNSTSDFEFRNEIIELINNLILLNSTDFITNLIKNGISEQISNIQDYLLEYDNNNSTADENNNMKILYNSHIELIYNLISTQSENAISDLCIENGCISNLFKLINSTKFCFNNNNSKILEIFDLTIKSNTEFVISSLLTEGIYDLYKNILFNCNNNELIEMILNDIAIMIEKGKSIKTSSRINFVSNHFIQNGIFDLIDNIKAKTEFNEKINYLLDEIQNLLKEKTS